MAETKHTPGPWFLFGNPAHCVGGPHPENGTGGVAMCGMRLRSPEEAEANAKLIAAAPDLLITLHDVWIWQQGIQDSMPDELIERVCALLRGAGIDPTPR